MTNKYTLQIIDAEYAIKQLPDDAAMNDGAWVFIDAKSNVVSKPFSNAVDCAAALAARIARQH